MMTAPWARVAPRDETEEKGDDGRFHDQKIYFTVAPGGFDVDCATVGTAIGATSRPSTIGLLVVRSIGQIIPCPQTSDVITRTIPVIVLWIGRALRSMQGEMILGQNRHDFLVHRIFGSASNQLPFISDA